MIGKPSGDHFGKSMEKLLLLAMNGLIWGLIIALIAPSRHY